jgi:hypothetical protein
MNRKFQNLSKGLLKVAATLVATSSILLGQSNFAIQQLNLQVLEVTRIGVSEKGIRLIVDRSGPDARQDSQAFHADGELVWTTNGTHKKITVSSRVKSRRFELRVSPVLEGHDGAARAEDVLVSASGPKDLVVGINRNAGKCRVVLTALAPLSGSTGTDVHEVTYTLTGS